MKKLKILLEMTDEGEPEIIIKCHKLTPDIIKLQQMLASYDAGNGSLNQIIFYKGDTEYYMNLNEILFFKQKVLLYMLILQQMHMKPNINFMNLKKSSRQPLSGYQNQP